MADIDTTYESLVRRSAVPLQTICLNDVAGGNKVIKIPDHKIVIKSGRGTTEGEAITQRQVSSILNREIIYVPHVYHFFHDGNKNIGYIFMEYVEGEPINVYNNAHVGALRKAFDHLASFKRKFPGPLHSGEPQGILWEDEIPSNYNTLDGLENWINTRQDDQVVLRGEEFVLCHLDTALHNILWLPSGTICLLDWASAGYFPRHFELAAHQKKGRPDEIVEGLLKSPRKPFSAQEIRHKKSIIQACANAMRFARPSRPRVTEPTSRKFYLHKQPSFPKMVPDMPSH